MVKLASPWLRSLLRAGKRQQRSVARVVGTLLAAPKAAKPRAKAKLQPKPKPRATPAAGKWLASHYTCLPGEGGLPARRMLYWLYLPDAPPGPAGMPLLVMLHGCGQSATQFAQGTRMNQLAEAQGFAVLYPQQSLQAHPRRCWKWYDRATQLGGGDVPLIAGIVQKVVQRYPVDRSRLFLSGLSAGAGMAHIVALNHPGMFAGLGLHSGPVFGAGHNAVGALGVMQHGAAARADDAIAEVMARHRAFPPLPIMLIQGDKDAVVRPVNQTQLARQAMLLNRLPAGSAARATLKPGGPRGRAYQLQDVRRGRELLLRVVRVAGLDHAWSGGDATLAYQSGTGPDASKMLLDFFRCA
jgi:poly(hydroxyalkanoate) depolymerase family esterase